MLVTITNSSSEKSWYRDRIGESFYVLNSTGGKHRLDAQYYQNERFAHFFIRVEDCVPIREQEHKKQYIKDEDLYSFFCLHCDWVFKCTVNTKLKCEYCKKEIMTNPFNETDRVGEVGTTKGI